MHRECMEVQGGVFRGSWRFAKGYEEVHRGVVEVLTGCRWVQGSVQRCVGGSKGERVGCLTNHCLVGDNREFVF